MSVTQIKITASGENTSTTVPESQTAVANELPPTNENNESNIEAEEYEETIKDISDEKQQNLESVQKTYSADLFNLAVVKSVESTAVDNFLSDNEEEQEQNERRKTLENFDFTPTKENAFEADTITLTSKRSLSMESYVESPSKTPELSAESSTEQIDPNLDRLIYYELHALYTKQQKEQKILNSIYQKKVTDYYIRRRMYHVFHIDPKTLFEQEKSYKKLLEEFDTVHERCIREQDDLLGEIEVLKNKCKFRREELHTLFAKLEKIQLDYGKELSSSGDQSVEKFVERCLKRQKSVLGTLIKMRLTYINLVNNYNEKQNMINALDSLGSNFRLIDYEQLKSDNRKLNDTVEEKESALGLLRKQCQHSMQVLAHTREKSFALNVDISRFVEENESLAADCDDVRAQLAYLKLERDALRKEVAKLTSHCGLLTRPKLLKDMEQTLNDIELGKQELEAIKYDVKEIEEDIRLLKKHSY